MFTPPPEQREGMGDGGERNQIDGHGGFAPIKQRRLYSEGWEQAQFDRQSKRSCLMKWHEQTGRGDWGVGLGFPHTLSPTQQKGESLATDMHGA